MWPETVTGCVCEQPGWCERHRCVKTAHWHLLCRLDLCEFQRWEAGDGPCLDRPPQYQAELPRCRHRGAKPIDRVQCDLCGGRSMLAPVYYCEKFDRCTTRRYGTRTQEARSMPACMTCAEHSPVDQAESPAFDQ